MGRKGKEYMTCAAHSDTRGKKDVFKDVILVLLSRNFSLFCCMDNHFEVRGHVQTDAPDEPQMTLNTTISKVAHLCVIRLPNFTPCHSATEVKALRLLLPKQLLVLCYWCVSGCCVKSARLFISICFTPRSTRSSSVCTVSPSSVNSSLLETIYGQRIINHIAIRTVLTNFLSKFPLC